MGEEDGGQSQGIHHGYKPAPLLEPVLLRATQAAGIVLDSAAQLVSLMAYHVPQFIQRQACILWMLLDVYSPCLQSTPPHLSVEGKVAKARVSGKPAIAIPNQVLEVVAHHE